MTQVNSLCPMLKNPDICIGPPAGHWWLTWALLHLQAGTDKLAFTQAHWSNAVSGKRLEYFTTETVCGVSESKSFLCLSQYFGFLS